MIVRRRVLEQTIDLIGRAMSRLPTEIQPPLPVQSMVGFRLAADLVGEAKAASLANQRSYARVQCGLVLDVVQADGADYEIERAFRKIELFETRDEICNASTRTGRSFVDARANQSDHFLRPIDQSNRGAR